MISQPLLHQKLYQFYLEGHEVDICFRDQARWLENARVIQMEGELVTFQYYTEENEEFCSWKEIVRLDSISSVVCKLGIAPKENIVHKLSKDNL